MGRKISYEAYVREYKREEAKHEMYSPMFNKDTFEAVYEGMANSMREKGQRVQNITRNIIQRQSYQLSYKQAKAFKQAREALDMESKSIKEIRQMDKSDAIDWAAIKKAYHDYKEETASGALDAKRYISQVIFGSE